MIICPKISNCCPFLRVKQSKQAKNCRNGEGERQCKHLLKYLSPSTTPHLQMWDAGGWNRRGYKRVRKTFYSRFGVSIFLIVTFKKKEYFGSKIQDFQKKNKVKFVSIVYYFRGFKVLWNKFVLYRDVRNKLSSKLKPLVTNHWSFL